ncbi:MAG: hypothetical protein JNL60_16175 [Bacteroidia bacterium]|nr:hypothetical protein [Bacteroidia bacterium]
MKLTTPQLLAACFSLMLCLVFNSLTAQVAFEELEFEMDSTTSAYRPSGKNFALLKSKRGSSGMNKTPLGDALVNSEVTEIVLVYTETEASDLAEREDANRERWENLIKTYPELFQFSTTYKNVCQCRIGGDAEALKGSQGFYIYVNGEVPKVDEPKAVAETPKPVAAETPKPVATETPKPAEKKPAEAPAPAKAETPAPVKEVAKADNTSVKPQDPPPVVEAKTETAKAPATPPPPAEPVTEEEPAAEAPKPVAKSAPKKAAGLAKPRRAKDPKACRQPCYGFGDEDLVAFFKDNITLSKKQKRKAKNWVANVRLQINHDGSIKKAMVTGAEENFNEMVNTALKSMNNWNAAVKNGLAVKSEVRFTLKYDKSTKSMRPGDFIMNPKASPKCPCVTDGEMFD